MLGRRSDDDLDRNIQAHLELLAAEHERRGMSPQAAREAARRDFGGIAQVQETCRDARGWRWFDDLRQDLRIGLRSLLRQPGFALLTVLTLALGIGVNTAIFSVANGVLFSPLPYAGADRLVMVWSRNTREGIDTYPVSPANFIDIKRATKVLGHVEAMLSFRTGAILRTTSGTEQISLHAVTPGMFPLLGTAAAIGRAPTLSDRQIVVLSEGFWTRRFGRDPSIVGRRLTIDGRDLAVAGVMPADFDFPLQGMLGPATFVTNTATDVWTLIDPADPQSLFSPPRRNVHFLSVIGRLQPGATAVQAEEEAVAIMARLAEMYPDANAGLSANVVPLRDQAVGAARPALRLLLGAVGLVLLIACVNVTNLLLARSVARQQELALCVALGAPRRRILQKILVEGVLLAGAGAMVAAAFVSAAVGAFIRLAPADMPRLANVAPTWTVALFGLTLTLAIGLLVGLIPALLAGRADAQAMLRAASRGATSGLPQRRLRAALVIGEVALAVILIIGGGLLVRSFARVVTVDPGFRSEGLLTLQATLPVRLTSAEARLAFLDEMLTAVDGLPGVAAVGGTTRLPLGSANTTTILTVEGRGTDPSEMPEVEFRRAIGDYFGAMGVPLVSGRGFTTSDRAGAPPVVLINQALARRVWPGEDPIGKRVRFGPNPNAPWNTVIGVVGDVRHMGLDRPPIPELYISHRQGPPITPFLVVRTAGDPSSIASAVRERLVSLDRDLAVYDIRTMDDVRRASLTGRRFVAALTSVFSVLALLLAAIGIHGVIGLAVSERTREMGIRLALGAPRSGVLGLVLRQSLVLTAAGVALGVAGASALTGVLRGMLFELTPLDPVTFTGASLVCVAAAALATLVPAWRAMRVDPLVSLRAE